MSSAVAQSNRIVSALHHTRFGEFLSALHGNGVVPFPWQWRLAARVVETAEPDRAWPQAMALPTASGKTACIDIAVFALACQAHLPPEKRTAARRIFFIVDRRVVVDEAFERSAKIANALRKATRGILREVTEALLLVSGDPDSVPLAFFQLRGGVYRDDAWARTPTQPTIIASTVDQIGSRLLFRGYGVSAGMRPIHAGLAANDSLIILDEAHCAQPFMQTLVAVKSYRLLGTQPLKAPFRVVFVSATPPPQLVDVMKTDADDLDDPILGKRLRASKPTRLVEAKQATGKKAIEELSQELTEQALILAKGKMPKAVAVMVNRVAAARRVRELLAKRTTADVVLLMGRMRPIDRDIITRDWLSRLNATMTGTRSLTRHVFIVATQCLEVGANLDFDALVTECASLDALRQRFGRLNRSGRNIETRGVIVVRADEVKAADKPADEDPIYGNALPRTWAWLNKHAKRHEIDFSVNAIDAVIEGGSAHDAQAFRSLLAPAASAPVMFPAYVDCWAQTSPEPVPSPDVSIFLHGPDRGVADVQVCWRADLPVDDSVGRISIQVLSLCPPASQELMRVPYTVFVRWFAGDDSVDTGTGDVEGSATLDALPKLQTAAGRSAIRWLGPEQSQLLKDPEDIKPGDTLVLPASAGGWDLFGYVPEECATPARIDAGGEANLRARATPTLRLHESLLNTWPDCPAKQSALGLLEPAFFAERLGSAEFLDQLLQALCSIREEPRLPEWLRDSAEALARSPSKLGRRVASYPPGAGCGLVIHSYDRIAKYARSGQSDFTDEDDSSSAAAPRLLRDHCEDVARKLRSFTGGCALPAAVAQDAILAAGLHDLGKADPRFQALLRSGDHRAVGALLAKSDRVPAGWQAYLAARDRAGYPAGARHELLSLRLAESDESLLAGASDSELVLHLIASHHGYARPFAPAVDDPKPENVAVQWNGAALSASSRTSLERLESGVAERFWRLVRRYGWWGLAYLEALLRLADHRASEKGSDAKNPQAATTQ